VSSPRGSARAPLSERRDALGGAPGDAPEPARCEADDHDQEEPGDERAPVLVALELLLELEVAAYRAVEKARIRRSIAAKTASRTFDDSP